MQVSTTINCNHDLPTFIFYPTEQLRLRSQHNSTTITTAIRLDHIRDSGYSEVSQAKFLPLGRNQRCDTYVHCSSCLLLCQLLPVSPSGVCWKTTGQRI